MISQAISGVLAVANKSRPTLQAKITAQRQMTLLGIKRNTNDYAIKVTALRTSWHTIVIKGGVVGYPQVY